MQLIFLLIILFILYSCMNSNESKEKYWNIHTRYPKYGLYRNYWNPSLNYWRFPRSTFRRGRLHPYIYNFPYYASGNYYYVYPYSSQYW